MIKTTKATKTAASKFAWQLGGYKDAELVYGLILCAFHLYQQHWNRWRGAKGRQFNIENWNWPRLCLEGNAKLEGDAPWTVLLRRAFELAGKQV